MTTLVRTLQCFLALAFVASVYHTCISASFWIALMQAQASERQELLDYISAFSGPALDLLRNVQYLAFATILELMLRIQHMMLIRRPR